MSMTAPVKILHKSNLHEIHVFSYIYGPESSRAGNDGAGIQQDSAVCSNSCLVSAPSDSGRDAHWVPPLQGGKTRDQLRSQLISTRNSGLFQTNLSNKTPRGNDVLQGTHELPYGNTGSLGSQT